jgi:hypothetical protein
MKQGLDRIIELIVKSPHEERLVMRFLTLVADEDDGDEKCELLLKVAQTCLMHHPWITLAIAFEIYKYAHQLGLGDYEVKALKVSMACLRILGKLAAAAEVKSEIEQILRRLGLPASEELADMESTAAEDAEPVAAVAPGAEKCEPPPQVKNVQDIDAPAALPPPHELLFDKKPSEPQAAQVSLSSEELRKLFDVGFKEEDKSQPNPEASIPAVFTCAFEYTSAKNAAQAGPVAPLAPNEPPQPALDAIFKEQESMGPVQPPEPPAAKNEEAQSPIPFIEETVAKAVAPQVPHGETFLALYQYLTGVDTHADLVRTYPQQKDLTSFISARCSAAMITAPECCYVKLARVFGEGKDYCDGGFCQNFTITLWYELGLHHVQNLLAMCHQDEQAAEFWGHYLDLLIVKKRARRALFEIRRVIDKDSGIEWAKAAYERLPQILSQLKLKRFAWSLHEGSTKLAQRLARRPLPSMSGMFVGL